MKNLFCLPHAGGSASVYYKWGNILREDINIIPIELKGRGERFDETFYSSASELLDDVIEKIESHEMDSFNLFGHSFGGLIALQIAYICQQRKNKLVDVIVSGIRPPHSYKERKSFSNLNDNDFIKEIKGIGCLHDELLKNKELFDLFFPILRNDCRLLEELSTLQFNEKLNCNLTVFQGDIDFFSKTDSVNNWKVYSHKKCELVEFPGDHFFIYPNESEVIKSVAQTLKN